MVAAISEQLRSIGLDHVPRDVPRNQTSVVAFKIVSDAGAVINAIRNGTSSAEAERALSKLNISDSIMANQRDEAKIVLCA